MSTSKVSTVSGSGEPSGTKSGTGTLKRTLNTWEAIGVSVALMAPSVAINIAPQSSAGLVGAAVPLTFLMAFVGILLLCYTFVRLSQRFNHAGSLYGFVGATIGPRAGVFIGWLLTGVYLLSAVITVCASGHFFLAAFKLFGWVDDSVSDYWAYAICVVVLAVVWWACTRHTKVTGRAVLYIEIGTILLILVVAMAVLIRLVTGTAHTTHQGFSFSVFAIPTGIDTSTLFLGAVFGILAFVGFEAAATLGEETNNPRRAVPRAILGTAIFGGLFFVIMTAIEVNGFGTSHAGIKNFIASGSLFGDLGSTYVAPVLGGLITVGAAVGGFSSAVASTIGGSRLLFALSRDGVGIAPLAKISSDKSIPKRSVTAVVFATAAICIAAGLIIKIDPFTVFGIFGSSSVLLILVCYIFATIGAIRLLFFRTVRTVSRLEIIIPVLTIVVFGYTLFRSVWPLPTGMAWWATGFAILWVLGTAALLIFRRAAVARAGVMLTESEGLQEEVSS